VKEVGSGVHGLKPGDHVVTSFIPGCGRCEFCARGQQNLCETGALIMRGQQMDGSFRRRYNGQPVAVSALIGAFAEYSVMPQWSCVRIPEHIPLRAAALVGCGVPTGWGSAVNAAHVRPGQIVIVMGVGGIGINAVQGAAHAGADSAIVTTGVLSGEHIGDAFDAIRKGGTVVVTAVAPMAVSSIPVSPFILAMFNKRLQGCLYGMMSPSGDIPRLLRMYERGQLKLDELVTRTYRLDEINIGYQDMHAGRNIRGVIEFS
jgi:S-(hydroxymethyl)glutathione dehydrogenase/alcohol dehydrogenase